MPSEQSESTHMSSFSDCQAVERPNSDIYHFEFS